MKKIFSWRTLYMSALWLSGPLLLFAVIYPIFARYWENERPNVCRSNLRQIALAVFQYSQDYNEHCPLVNVHDAAISGKHPLGWADALQPYLKSTSLFQCPKEVDEAKDRQPNQQGYTDYWYNARLNAVEQKALLHPSSTLLLGEGNDGTDATNARYNLSELPASWMKNEDSPSKRHDRGAHYVFTDGHAIGMWPDNIRNQKPDGENVTFLVQ